MSEDTPKPAETAPAAPEANMPKPAAKPRASARAAKPAAAKPAPRRTAPAASTSAVKKPVVKPASAPRPAPAKKAAPAAKAAPTAKAAPVAKSATADRKEKPVKARKVKLVRDSFTMPEPEYAVIALLKKRCLNAGVSAKKSEILRAAIAGLAKLSDTSVVAAIRRLEVIKTGRPAKSSK